MTPTFDRREFLKRFLGLGAVAALVPVAAERFDTVTTWEHKDPMVGANEIDACNFRKTEITTDYAGEVIQIIEFYEDGSILSIWNK